ncbi:MAG: type I restriction endonuclease subunit R [Paludibacteraceae bacterium]|nr:type I restriction endonuclease subunit R [Paludibacteraceae bacterium]
MSNPFTEDSLIQAAAANLLHDELGWKTVFAFDEEKLGENGTLGRTSHAEVVLVRYLKEALRKFNPWISTQQEEEVVRKMLSHVSTASLMQTNEQKYNLIRDGVEVSCTMPDGSVGRRKAKVIDFKEPESNSFIAVRELWIKGSYHKRRADIVGFVNGLPLLFVELKNHHVDVEDAYNNNYSDYLDTVPHLFYHNAMIILSNGKTAKIGTIGSKFEFFHEWKRLKEEDKGNVELATMLRGVCKKENFIDLLENFLLYDHSDGNTVKILARNHQFLGVNEAVQAYRDRKLRNGKLGVFWHTQGSGKSYSMLFLAQKITRKFEGTPTIVVLTDRDELNKQISDTFENCGLLGGSKAKQYMAKSGSDLVEKLGGNPAYIFTLIQKFNKTPVEPIMPDHDILIMSDEAHRSQYGLYAENMNKLLPTASKIGFTGTPLLSSDNITERTFGNYISIYDFQRAVEDHATVPLYYENRGEKIDAIKNPDINEKILEAIAEADLDPARQEKLEREFAQEIHILTAEPRLDAIANDFVEHYSDLWTSGKAMFVCLNKVTCVRMYNLVQKYWGQKIAALEKEMKRATQQEAMELGHKLAWMKETEMCVVVSQEQNEIKTFQHWGLDILPHRAKMEKRELDKEFKKSDNPFRVVFVCAMWLTGFDVKSLSCLYLDKPLQAHTLMQTIARANRVNEGKSNGLVVDYIGIVKALRKALADYTANKGKKGGEDPTIDKEKLLIKIGEVITNVKSLLKEHEYNLNDLVACRADTFDRMEQLLKAADAVCVSAEVRKTFMTYASELVRLVKFVCRKELPQEIAEAKDAIRAIYKQLCKQRKHADNTELMVEINKIVSDYVTMEQKFGTEANKQFDISNIDFDILRKEFARVNKRNLLLKDLDELVKKRLDSMLKINPERVNFYEKYKSIIDAYNDEQNRASIEKTFDELMRLADSLSQEEQRYVRKEFQNDEQLAIYDLLFVENLSSKDIKKIKEVSVELLEKVKAAVESIDHCFDKEEGRANVQIIIRDVLFQDLPDSVFGNFEMYQRKVYDYVYARYSGVSA